MGYRRKTGVGREEIEQGYIYYYTRLYEHLTPESRREIDDVCRRAAGDYWQALREYVTTDAGAVAVCMRHYISRATLYRCVRRYYEMFDI